MKRNAVIFIGLSALLALLFCLDVCSGSLWLWPFGDLNPMEQNILHAIRFPKAITAILAGAALSVSGLIMQTTLNNALASPSVLGVSNESQRTDRFRYRWRGPHGHRRREGAPEGGGLRGVAVGESVDRRFDVRFYRRRVSESAAELR